MPETDARTKPVVLHVMQTGEPVKCSCHKVALYDFNSAYSGPMCADCAAWYLAGWMQVDITVYDS